MDVTNMFDNMVAMATIVNYISAVYPFPYSLFNFRSQRFDVSSDVN